MTLRMLNTTTGKKSQKIQRQEREIEPLSLQGFNSVDVALEDGLGFHGAVVPFCGDKTLVEKLLLIPLL